MKRRGVKNVSNSMYSDNSSFTAMVPRLQSLEEFIKCSDTWVVNILIKFYSEPRNLYFFIKNEHGILVTMIQILDHAKQIYVVHI